MSTSDETSEPTGGDTAPPASSPPSGGPPRNTTMLALGAVLAVVTVGLLAISIWSFSIDHTKRATAALIVAVLAAGAGAYVFWKSRES